MDQTISIIFPAPPAVFASFLWALLTYLVYSIAKVAVSLLKGT